MMAIESLITYGYTFKFTDIVDTRFVNLVDATSIIFNDTEDQSFFDTSNFNSLPHDPILVYFIINNNNIRSTKVCVRLSVVDTQDIWSDINEKKTEVRSELFKTIESKETIDLIIFNYFKVSLKRTGNKEIDRNYEFILKGFNKENKEIFKIIEVIPMRWCNIKEIYTNK